MWLNAETLALSLVSIAMKSFIAASSLTLWKGQTHEDLTIFIVLTPAPVMARYSSGDAMM